jgi:hypothetical protein
MTAVLVVIGILATAREASALDRFTPDGPPCYHDCQIVTVIDGEFFAIHDGEWAVIPWWRSIEDIPAGFDLLNDFDPNVWNAEVYMEGSILVDDGALFATQVQGLGAVPMWFVAWDELQAAAGDGALLVEELEAMDSLVVGTADVYTEINHVYGVHPVSHLTMVASGALEDGREFDVRAVERGLELVNVSIDFD